MGLEIERNKSSDSSQNKEPPETSGFRGFFVAGTVLLDCFAALRVLVGDALLPEARTHFARIGLFIPIRLQKQAFDALGNKKPGALSYTGLLLVDYVIEISNQDLLKNLVEVADFMNDDAGHQSLLFRNRPCLSGK